MRLLIIILQRCTDKERERERQKDDDDDEEEGGGKVGVERKIVIKCGMNS